MQVFRETYLWITLLAQNQTAVWFCASRKKHRRAVLFLIISSLLLNPCSPIEILQSVDERPPPLLRGGMTKLMLPRKVNSRAVSQQ